MSYRLKQPKSNPIAMWLLDDTIPFQEHSGSGLFATAAAAVGSGPPLVAGAVRANEFTNTTIGNFTSPVFQQGQESKPFALGAWVLQEVVGTQQILSHNGVYDGLWLENKIIHFTTTYLTSGSATCSYDMGATRSVYIVGVHTATHNQLWINGVLADTVALTDDQKNDSYIATDGFLYSGDSATNARIAVNGMELYNTISAENIMRNYRAGIDVVPQESVPPQFNGVPIALNASVGSVYFEQTWKDRFDFDRGYNNGVSIEDNRLSPKLSDTEVSLAGEWTTSVMLDVANVASAYGVMIEYNGANVTVECSVNGSTWSAATSGELTSVVTNGYATTGKFLQIRVKFAAGLAEGAAYLDSLTAVGFANANINSSENRIITVTYPATPRKDFQPIEHNDENGVNLRGGTLTINPDTSTDPNPLRTLEVWMKNITGTVTFTGATFTKMRNGIVSSSVTTGEWSLLHYTSPTDITGPVTIQGTCIIGQIALYPTELTLANALHLYRSYMGKPVLSFIDTSPIAISEPAFPTALYVRDWSIEGAGG